MSRKLESRQISRFPRTASPRVDVVFIQKSSVKSPVPTLPTSLPKLISALFPSNENAWSCLPGANCAPFKSVPLAAPAPSLAFPSAGQRASWPAQAPHTTGLPPVQAPAAQVSVRVQAFPSLQAVPSGAAGLLQDPVAGSQLP